MAWLTKTLSGYYLEMEQMKMKRAREGDDHETQKGCFENNNKAKKRDVHGMKLMKKDVGKEKEGCSSESHLALGVFDFPWLKDGVSNYLLDFEDNFSSFLQQEDASFKGASIDFSMCETLEAKLEDIAWNPFESDLLKLEAEDVDCIWTSLLNQPL
ncbi:hypothetical protein CR513_15139, partial [Mucuna pruriens]